MVLEASTLITIFTILGFFGGGITFFCKIHKWYLKQEEQSNDIALLKEKHAEDVKRLNKENALVIYALSACLDGLSQLGANHTVPKAKEALDKHLNLQAHTIE